MAPATAKRSKSNATSIPARARDPDGAAVGDGRRVWGSPWAFPLEGRAHVTGSGSRTSSQKPCRVSSGWPRPSGWGTRSGQEGGEARGSRDVVIVYGSRPGRRNKNESG